jgi:hypothetical protein
MSYGGTSTTQLDSPTDQRLDIYTPSTRHANRGNGMHLAAVLNYPTFRLT